MTQKRKQFSKQFKMDAVKLVTEQGYKVSEAARNLGIGCDHLSVFYFWHFLGYGDFHKNSAF